MGTCTIWKSQEHPFLTELTSRNGIESTGYRLTAGIKCIGLTSSIYQGTTPMVVGAKMAPPNPPRNVGITAQMNWSPGIRDRFGSEKYEHPPRFIWQ